MSVQIMISVRHGEYAITAVDGNVVVYESSTVVDSGAVLLEKSATDDIYELLPQPIALIVDDMDGVLAELAAALAFDANLKSS